MDLVPLHLESTTEKGRKYEIRKNGWGKKWSMCIGKCLFSINKEGEDKYCDVKG